MATFENEDYISFNLEYKEIIKESNGNTTFAGLAKNLIIQLEQRIV